mgnify:CR=1 FL=1
MKDILREIGMIARCFESIANIEFKAYHLSKNQYIYLVRIVENPGIILERLSELVKVDRSTASRAVKKLVDQGIVKKVDVNQTGKRIQLIPTEKGLSLFEILKEEEVYSSRISLEGFTQDEINSFLKYLKRMRENIEPEWEKVKKGQVRDYLK